jgi:hypothetical protein
MSWRPCFAAVHWLMAGPGITGMAPTSLPREPRYSVRSLRLRKIS